VAEENKSALEIRVYDLGELGTGGLFKGDLACWQASGAQFYEVLQVGGNSVPEEGLQQFTAALRRGDVEQFADRLTADFDASAEPAGHGGLIGAQAVREVLLGPARFFEEPR